MVISLNPLRGEHGGDAEVLVTLAETFPPKEKGGLEPP
jgi:hypothetical protein